MEQAMSTQVSEVFTRGKWIYRDPHDGCKELTSESHELGAIVVRSLFHCSHKEEASIIVKHKRAFLSQPLLAPPGSWIVNGSTTTLSTTGQDPVLPGDYIRFTVSAEPTPEQCRYMRKKRGNRYAYYLTTRSPYGMYAFSADLFELLKAYADSHRCQELVLKVGGTRHFKNQVFYVMVVCALMDGEDPLPDLPNLPLTEEKDQEKIFDPGEMLDSHGRVLLAQPGRQGKDKEGNDGGGGGGDNMDEEQGRDESAEEQMTELRTDEELQKKKEQGKNGSKEASSHPKEPESEEEQDREQRKGGRLSNDGSEEECSSPTKEPESIGEGGGDVTWVVLNELGRDREQEKDKEEPGTTGIEEPSSEPMEELQSEPEGKGGEGTRETENGAKSQDGEGYEIKERMGYAGPPEWSYSPEAMPKFLPRNPLEEVDGVPQKYDALELVFHFPAPRFAVPSEEPTALLSATQELHTDSHCTESSHSSTASSVL